MLPEHSPNVSGTELQTCAICGRTSDQENPVFTRPTSPETMNRLAPEDERLTCASCWDALLTGYQLERPPLDAWIAAQQEAIGIPLPYRGLRIANMDLSIQNALGEMLVLQERIESGALPANGVAISGYRDAGKALAIILRMVLRAWGKANLSSLPRDVAFHGRVSQIRPASHLVV